MTVVGTTIGLKKLDFDRIAQAGILASTFFVASLIHIPVGPASTHLILNGIIGLILGWSAFPVILVALLLQAVFFQFGGLTTLGINTLNMALPAVLCHYLGAPMLSKSAKSASIAAFACGFLAAALAAVGVGGTLVLANYEFWEVSTLIVAANIPVMLIEGFVTASCVAFLLKVQPTLLGTAKGA